MIENKKRMEITLDNYTYKYLKEKKINASKLIRQLLRVALFSASNNDTNGTNSWLKRQTHNLETASPNLARGTFILFLIQQIHLKYVLN